MALLKTLIIDINRLNDGDSIEEFILNTSFSVVKGIANFSGKNTLSAFVITDNRSAANHANYLGLGIAVYTNDLNNAGDFPEALYCIDNLKEMSDKNIERMFLRANDLPWDILESERCLVREITVDDVDRMYAIYSDADVREYIEDLYSEREEEIQYTKDYIANQYRFYEYGLWVVIEKSTNTIIGRAGIFDRPDQDLQEIGFVFAKEYWGRGFATEVLTKIMEYAKEELDIESLYAHVYRENIRSKKLLESLGFSYVCEANVDDKIFDRYKIII